MDYTSKKKVKVGNLWIGEGEPCFIIAEAAVNHNGKIEIAKQLALNAKAAGADAIKYQLHIPEKEMLRDIPTSYNFDKPLYDILKETNLTVEEHKELMEYCKKIGILYLCTPFSREAANILDEMGVQAFKIGSGELTNIPLLKHVAKKRKPMIVSTGMSFIPEIKETVSVIKGMDVPLILTHCTSAYPTKYEDVNLKLIPKYREMFDIPIGLSDHSKGIYTALAAIALGANLVEKHFTLDKLQAGPDHKVSIEPYELIELVKGARAIELAMGEKKEIVEDEKEIVTWARESVVSIQDIKKGTKITGDMVWVKRPGTGIPAKDQYNVIGRKAVRDISANSLIKWEDLE